MLYDLQADGDAQAELAILIATLQDGTRKWRAGLGRVSPQAMVWQPYELSPSIGGFILHMVDVEAYWLRIFAAGEAEDQSKPETAYNNRLEQYKHAWPAPPKKPLSWYYDLQNARRAEHLEYIRRQADPAEAQGRGKHQATYCWIVAHLVEHDSYHGGQAVLLHEMFKRMRKLNR